MRLNLDPLYDYQRDNAHRLLDLLISRSSAADRSDMGTGKTYTAAVVARELGLRTIVVTPKSTIPNWWQVNVQVGAHINLVVNYESLRAGKYSIYDKQNGWALPEQSLIIFDEAHKLRARKSQQTAMLVKAKEAGHKILLLSATLISSALDLSAIGYALGMFNSPRAWWPFTRRFGGYLNRWGGYDASTSHNHLLALSAELDKVSCRTRIEELGLDLPCVTTADQVDCGHLQSLVETIEETQEEAAEEEDEDKYNAAHIIARGRARQACEEAKIPYLVDETRSLVSNGYSVVLFVNYQATVLKLHESLYATASFLHGGQSEQERQREIDAFQTNNTKVLVANIKCGGVGLSLHDTNGKHPRVALISPPESAIDLQQCLGRVRRVGMASPAVNRIVFAANSVETRVYKNVSRKLKNISLINDSDLEYECNNNESKNV